MEALVTSFGLDWRVFISEVVNFLILLGVIYFVIKKFVTPVLEERRAVIASGVEKSEKAAEILESAEKESDSMIAEANQKSSETIAASVEKGKKREADIIAKAEGDAGSILENAQKKGESQKQAIIDGSKEDIAKMIVLGTEKVLRTK